MKTFTNKPGDLVEQLLDPDSNLPKYMRRGLYRAIVVDNDDPEKRGRLQIRCPQFHGAQETPTGSPQPSPTSGVPRRLLPWAEPCLPFAGPGHGFVMLPEEGSVVWVGFELGWVDKPVWLGSWYGEGDFPSDLLTDNDKHRIIRTPFGHYLFFNDTDPGSVEIRHADDSKHVILDGFNDRIDIQDGNQRVRIDKGNDQIVIEQAAGVKITLDGATGKVIIDSTGDVEVNTAGANAVINTAGGDVDVNAGAGAATVDAASATVTTTGDVNLKASGDVLLGDGASKGVVHEGFKGNYEGHTHPYLIATGPGVTGAAAAVTLATTATLTGPADFSTAVKAKES